jgi:hypothetical protein
VAPLLSFEALAKEDAGAQRFQDGSDAFSRQ